MDDGGGDATVSHPVAAEGGAASEREDKSGDKISQPFSNFPSLLSRSREQSPLLLPLLPSASTSISDCGGMRRENIRTMSRICFLLACNRRRSDGRRRHRPHRRQRGRRAERNCGIDGSTTCRNRIDGLGRLMMKPQHFSFEDDQPEVPRNYIYVSTWTPPLSNRICRRLRRRHRCPQL